MSDMNEHNCTCPQVPEVMSHDCPRHSALSEPEVHHSKMVKKYTMSYWIIRLLMVTIPAALGVVGVYVKTHAETEAGYQAMKGAVEEMQGSMKTVMAKMSFMDGELEAIKAQQKNPTIVIEAKSQKLPRSPNFRALPENLDKLMANVQPNPLQIMEPLDVRGTLDDAHPSDVKNTAITTMKAAK